MRRVMLAVVLAVVFVGCALPPTPVVVEKVIRETVVVERAVVIEREKEVTKIVFKEVTPTFTPSTTPTPSPTLTPTMNEVQILQTKVAELERTPTKVPAMISIASTTVPPTPAKRLVRVKIDGLDQDELSCSTVGTLRDGKVQQVQKAAQLVEFWVTEETAIRFVGSADGLCPWSKRTLAPASDTRVVMIGQETVFFEFKAVPQAPPQSAPTKRPPFPPH